MSIRLSFGVWNGLCTKQRSLYRFYSCMSIFFSESLQRALNFNPGKACTFTSSANQTA